MSERLIMQGTFGYGEEVSDVCLFLDALLVLRLVNKEHGPFSLGGPVHRSSRRSQ
jgi:hypothetical protein